jgi:hypothetical protein
MGQPMRRTLTTLLLFVLVLTAWERASTPVAATAQASPQTRAVPSPSGTATNDFLDDSETVALPGTTTIEVDGEVGNPGKVNLALLPLRSVGVKETILKDGTNTFVGAYRYDGYALDEVLDRIVLQKKNQKEFRPIIDAYVEVSNSRGDSAVISWSEIYNPVHRHEILIATRVMHHVPRETMAQWPLPTETRLIVPSDLITERNIASPTRITVRSLDDPFKAEKTGGPFSPEFVITTGSQTVAHVTTTGAPTQEYPTVFYGRGQGIHAVAPFKGVLLREVLRPYVPITRESLRRGMLTVAGKDGFRAAYTVAEVMNRCDQSEVLLVDTGDGAGGRFRVFPSGDFFSSDRAVHTLAEIRYAVLK